MVLTKLCAVIAIICLLQGSLASSFYQSGSSVQGLTLEASEPNPISIRKSDRNVVLRFRLSPRSRQVVEKFDLEARTVNGIRLAVFPSSVKLRGFPITVQVVIKFIDPWVKCNQPYGVILTASNKFTKLTDALVIHVTGDDDMSGSGSGDFKMD